MIAWEPNRPHRLPSQREREYAEYLHARYAAQEPPSDLWGEALTILWVVLLFLNAG